MQTTQHISLVQLEEVLHAVFASESPIVKQATSDFDEPTKTFSSVDSLRENMRFSVGEEKAFFCYSMYYPDAKGMVAERRIDLNPGAVPGHTHRFSQEGWGLIQLQCNFRDFPSIECCVSVNSAERARNWADTFTRMGSPDLWEWKEVNRHAGRLVRPLRKLAKRADQQ
ncbi:MAG: hypothetical protein ACI9R3_004918 [Verrucomicrobiales bacterium]|jgi:hypothetical protein